MKPASRYSWPTDPTPPAKWLESANNRTSRGSLLPPSGFVTAYINGDARGPGRPTLRTATRQVRVADLPAVVGIDHEVYGVDSYTEMTMRQQFDIAGQLFSVAIDGDAVVGYALVVPTFREHEAYFMSLVACDDLGFSAIALTV